MLETRRLIFTGKYSFDAAVEWLSFRSDRREVD